MSASNALAQVVSEGPQQLRVPLFESITAGLDDEARHVLIDCGPARAGMIEMLTGLRCRLDVLDLPARLDSLATLPEDADLVAWFAERLPPAGSEPADLILCWNLLDYLTPAQISALMSVLIPRLRPGGRVHALVQYSSPRMPAGPGGMAPHGRTVLNVDSDGPANRNTPRHSRGTLEKFMQGLKAERTMLLSNGMQEYLFG